MTRLLWAFNAGVLAFASIAMLAATTAAFFLLPDAHEGVLVKLLIGAATAGGSAVLWRLSRDAS